MKKYLIVLLVVLLAGCGSSGDGEFVTIMDARDLNAEEQALSDAGTAFSFELFSALVARAGQENIFISPLSISMVLGMLLNGAGGDTYEAISHGLHLEALTIAEINQNYQGLLQYLKELDAAVTINLADSLWYDQGFSIEEAFADSCRTWFDAAVRGIDFSDASAKDMINEWVATATHDLIKSFIQSIPPETLLYLINALYFKGEWTDPFDPMDSSSQNFYRSDGSTSEVMMMRAERKMDYLGSDSLQAVRLPYGGGAFAMTVLLPAEGEDLDAFIAGLNPVRWAEISDSLKRTELLLRMPRYEFGYRTDLIPVLSDLGMAEIFGAADFYGISPDNLAVDQFFQQTYVRVGEEGTEAAAVTAGGGGGGYGDPAPPETMVVNRPFVVVIHDVCNDVVLFMGKIVDPPPFEPSGA